MNSALPITPDVKADSHLTSGDGDGNDEDNVFSQSSSASVYSNLIGSYNPILSAEYVHSHRTDALTRPLPAIWAAPCRGRCGT